MVSEGCLRGQLTVSATTFARRKPLVPAYGIPVEPLRNTGGEPLTLRTLITRIVLDEFAAYRTRTHERRLARVLCARAIETRLSSGKVDPGGREMKLEMSEDDAVATALQAFEDGLYLVILDGVEKRDIDEQVAVGAESTLVFVRLVMLAGA
jgi:hypothetical protein